MDRYVTIDTILQQKADETTTFPQSFKLPIIFVVEKNSNNNKKKYDFSIGENFNKYG